MFVAKDSYIQLFTNVKKQQVSATESFFSHLTMLQKLNLSGCVINNSVANVFVTIIPKMVSLKELDISKTHIRVNNVKVLGTLASCTTLQELNVSSNSFAFNSLVELAQAFKGHPNLQVLNMDHNITTLFSECEFLVDVILSTNQSLLYLNVCGRNIRPRFVEEYLSPPPNCEDCKTGFVLQNLFLSRYSSMDLLTLAENENVSYKNFTKTDEKCPISDKGIVSYYVDHTGGTFYNKEHDVAIFIPPGSVLQGECVQIQATASHFGPYQLPDGYYPISSFFWVSAHYTFKVPVYLIMSHYAYIRNLEDISNLCVLQACIRDLKVTSDGKLVMEEVPGGANFDCDINYCVFATNHFCSICLHKKDKYIPERFSAMYYTYDLQNSNDASYAEVCFCPSTSHCKEVCASSIVKHVSAV